MWPSEGGDLQSGNSKWSVPGKFKDEQWRQYGWKTESKAKIRRRWGQKGGRWDQVGEFVELWTWFYRLWTSFWVIQKVVKGFEQRNGYFPSLFFWFSSICIPFIFINYFLNLIFLVSPCSVPSFSVNHYALSFPTPIAAIFSRCLDILPLPWNYCEAVRQ